VAQRRKAAGRRVLLRRALLRRAQAGAVPHIVAVPHNSRAAGKQVPLG